ncbi:DUF1579 family protein [Dechloromonas sp. H13]|uniref:DUF1579 family protein n=1 Tax=Dechloromonas sp. H13 TaxID=2570193 RepID=UPI001290D187|nr:DUF1579 family protein [Dechloromonas sp. H13]
MDGKSLVARACLLGLAASFSSAAAADQAKPVKKESAARPSPESLVVDKWRGTWDIKATRRWPEPVTAVDYVETYEWVLDGQYLRSETSRKSDGGKSMSMVWFDINTKNYRFVIFDSNGIAVELPPPTWSESTQTMEWRGGLLSPVAYTGYATFTDPGTIRWKSLLKDWKGTVIVDIEGTSVRRK